MKKTTTGIVSALVALLLSSCSPNMDSAVAYLEPKNSAPRLPPTGLDGYVFESEEYRKTDVLVKVVYYQTQDELAAAWFKMRGAPKPVAGLEIAGFAKHYEYHGWEYCEIHLIDPKVSYRPHITGHEFLHCIHGNFHKEQDKKRFVFVKH